MIVSHSEVESFLLCERAHYYSFGEKIQRNNHPVELRRGNLGHAGLAVFFKALQKTGDWDFALKEIDEFFAQELRKGDYELVGDTYAICSGFLTTFRDRIQSWQIKEVEKEYGVQFPDFWFVCTVDLEVIEHGLRQLIDWKFTYDFYSPGAMNLLPQIPRYVGVSRALGNAVAGGHYGFLRTRSVKDPDPTLHYRIERVPLTNKKIENSFRDVITIAKRIAEMKSRITLENWADSTVRTANNMVCKRCQFLDPCGIEYQGENASLVKRVDYSTSTYGYSGYDVPK